MCGIVGYVGRDAKNFDLDGAVRGLHHRGPDEQGRWIADGVGLGHARLSIIDLSGGQQPMRSDDGRYCLVYNGEVYNFPDLRKDLESTGVAFRSHCDTEVILRLFMRDGLERCLKCLRGMFAFALWDNVEKTLFLARDRLGVKPLVYSENERGFIFGSEIGALFALDKALSRQPDLQAIDHYMTYQYIPAPLSGFRSVRKLPPAHAMIVRNGRVAKSWRYWDVDATERSGLSFEDAQEALREKFLEATRIRLVSDVPLGAFLSGGIDSSITVAAMSRLMTSPVKTFAVGFEEQKFNELPYARTIADHLNTQHHELVVKADAFSVLPTLVEHLGEPMADNSVIPTYFVAKAARQHVTVALTGDGGDEVFGGYRRFYEMKLLADLDRFGLTAAWRAGRKLGVRLEGLLNKRRRHLRFPANRFDEALSMAGNGRYKHLMAFFTDGDKASLYRAGFGEQIHVDGSNRYFDERWAEIGGSDPLNRFLFFYLKTYLPEDILVKVDIASMSTALECRSPFLDHELIEFAASLPGHYKLGPRGRSKWILKEAFKDWLPANFMDRKKQGFSSPVGDWLRGDLAPLLQERLIAEKRLANWFKQDKIESYVADHLSGKRTESRKLWSLLVLAEWLERYAVAT